jgi:hypothetical protein
MKESIMIRFKPALRRADHSLEGRVPGRCAVLRHVAALRRAVLRRAVLRRGSGAQRSALGVAGRRAMRLEGRAMRQKGKTDRHQGSARGLPPYY